MDPTEGLADLDYGPVERGVGLGERLRAVGRSPRYVIGGTVSVLTLAVPTVALVVMIAGGHTQDGGLLVFLGLVAAGGLYAVADVLRQAGGPGRLERFAEVNGLLHLSGSVATHYLGSRFADGSHVVQAAVRAGGDTLVEVGDIFPLTPLRSTRELRRPTAYLRVVVSGALPVGAADAASRVVDPGTEKELSRLLGPITVEVGWREVTVYGVRGLDPGRKGRLRCAMVLGERIGVAATAVAGQPGGAPGRTPSGVSIPVPPRKEPVRGRRLHPALLVLGTLAALVVLPLLFAFVMASLEPVVRGNGLVATIVVGVLVAVALAVVSRLVRLAHTYRRGDARGEREGR